jgi:hypothetical protein
MMLTTKKHSGMGDVPRVNFLMPAAPDASRTPPRGGFSMVVKRSNAPNRVRSMAIPVTPADAKTVYLAAPRSA